MELRYSPCAGVSSSRREIMTNVRGSLDALIVNARPWSRLFLRVLVAYP
jgi:hypothetical protein